MQRYSGSDEIQLVVRCPLTRAHHSACLAFRAADDTIPILCHCHVHEMGSVIPENRQPRPVKNQLLRDLQGAGVQETVLQRLPVRSVVNRNNADDSAIRSILQ